MQIGIGGTDLASFVNASPYKLLVGDDPRSLEIRVTVKYKDSLGNGRETSVHKRYDMTEFRLRPYGDSEFEYED